MKSNREPIQPGDPKQLREILAEAEKAAAPTTQEFQSARIREAKQKDEDVLYLVQICIAQQTPQIRKQLAREFRGGLDADRMILEAAGINMDEVDFDTENLIPDECNHIVRIFRSFEGADEAMREAARSGIITQLCVTASRED